MEDILKELERIVDKEAKVLHQEHFASMAEILCDMTDRLAKEGDFRDGVAVEFYLTTKTSKGEMSEAPSDQVFTQKMEMTDACRQSARLSRIAEIPSVKHFREFLNDKTIFSVMYEALEPIGYLARIKYPNDELLTVFVQEQQFIIRIQGTDHDTCVAFEYSGLDAEALSKIVRPKQLSLVQELSENLLTPKRMKEDEPELWEALMNSAKKRLSKEFGIGDDND